MAKGNLHASGPVLRRSARMLGEMIRAVRRSARWFGAGTSFPGRPNGHSAESLESRMLLAAGSAADYVIHISVDGLRPEMITQLGPAPVAPETRSASNFYRFRNLGAYTDQARTDTDQRITLPNHTSQLTSRRVAQAQGGHGWLLNDPAPPPALPFSQNIHQNNPPYVDSVFNVVKANGLTTSHYATKDKFEIYNLSYNGHPSFPGYPDVIDTFVNPGPNTPSMMTPLLTALETNPTNYTFVHFHDPDSAGHDTQTPGGGWMNDLYKTKVSEVNSRLGQIFARIDNQNSPLHGRTTVILTADHGGKDFGHSANIPENFTIPFYVWGAGVKAGELYTLSDHSRNAPPVAQNPAYPAAPYNVLTQPIRNGDAANLALDLLGLPSVPNSQINLYQNLNVGTLDIDGTAGDDVITVSLVGANLQVIKNGVTTDAGPAANYVQIIAHGRDGNDNVDIADNISLPAKLNGGAGNDILDGGGGNDLLSADGGGGNVYGAGGNDVLSGGAGGDDWLWGEDGHDILSSAEYGTGGAGNDVFDPGVWAADILSFGAGYDYFRNGSTGSVVVGLTDADETSVFSYANPGSGNVLTLNGSPLLFGGTVTAPAAGIFNIQFEAYGGDDTIDLSALSNAPFTSFYLCTLNGGAGDDLIIGSPINDDISGGDNSDRLEGRGGNDIIYGGDGDDTYVFSGSAALGTDIVELGGSGTDTLDFSAFGYAASVDLNSTSEQIVAATLRLVLAGQIEHILGSPQADNLRGTSGDNVLGGGGGNDILTGLGGTDVLNGGAGSDRYVFAGSSALGADTVNEIVDPSTDADVDTLDFTGITQAISVVLTQVTPREINSLLTLTLNNALGIENVWGSYSAASNITGNSRKNGLFAYGWAANTLSGGAGDDTLYGGDGTDVLSGGADNDYLDGGYGDDDLFGDDGNDYLFGNDGFDALHGYGDGQVDTLDEDGNDSIDSDPNDIIV